MIRAVLILAVLASPAAAADNNPFSGAREIRVVMVREFKPQRDFDVKGKSYRGSKNTANQIRPNRRP